MTFDILMQHLVFNPILLLKLIIFSKTDYMAAKFHSLWNEDGSNTTSEKGLYYSRLEFLTWFLKVCLYCTSKVQLRFMQTCGKKAKPANAGTSGSLAMTTQMPKW